MPVSSRPRSCRSQHAMPRIGAELPHVPTYLEEAVVKYCNCYYRRGAIRITNSGYLSCLSFSRKFKLTHSSFWPLSVYRRSSPCSPHGMQLEPSSLSKLCGHRIDSSVHCRKCFQKLSSSKSLASCPCLQCKYCSRLCGRIIGIILDHMTLKSV